MKLLNLRKETDVRNVIIWVLLLKKSAVKTFK